MDPYQLFFWLRGFCELEPGFPTTQQWDAIRAQILATNPKMPSFLPQLPSPCGCKDKKVS